jgi:hypothetical protein
VLTGNSGDNELSDDVGKDKLVGGDGNDTLSAGPTTTRSTAASAMTSLRRGTGDDSMAGGAGDDVYKVDSIKDKVARPSPTTRRVERTRSSAPSTFTLGANLVQPGPSRQHRTDQRHRQHARQRLTATTRTTS